MPRTSRPPLTSPFLRHRASSSTLAALVMLASGCGDEPAQVIDDTGTSEAATEDTGTTVGDETPTTDTGDTGTGDTGDTGDSCETTLCGGPATCCGGDEDCVEGACLPACESEVRCGDDLATCCAAGQLCLANACATPAGPCNDSLDCAVGEFCEPTLGQCLVQPAPGDCEFQPEFEAIDTVLEWSFESEQVASMPAVADIDGDLQPEVILNTYYAGGVEFRGEIVVLDGTDGTEQFRITHDPVNDQFGSYSRSTVGIADLDDDGLADIVYAGYPETGIAPFPNNASRIHAVDGLGQHLWTSHVADGSPYYVYVRQGAPVFANLDSDEASEIIFGTTILDNDGTVVFDQENGLMLGGGVFGSNGTFYGGISAVADLTGDSYPEIISGREAWTVTWTEPLMGPPEVNLSLLWTSNGADGYPAIADLDLDGDPEVVLVADPQPFTQTGQVMVLDGATGQRWCGVDATDMACLADPNLRSQPVAVRGGGRGGPPTIADFDGDGRPEIGVAGGSAYSVYDLHRADETIVVPAGDPQPALGEIYVRWSSPAQDLSSNSSGSSVFDFQADGVAELLFADECYLRIHAGDTGEVLYELENSSVTIHEYPIVVDVDGDGSSELLVVANDASANTNCGQIPGYTARRGVFAYADAQDQWVRTRQVWTSHGYHVTDATSTGVAPVVESNNWDHPELNNYRQSHYGAGLLNAPDLEGQLAFELGNCARGELEVVVTVRNTGALAAPAGVDVTLYRGTDANGTLVSSMPTSVALLPGEQTTLSWLEPAPTGPEDYFVVIDADDVETLHECVENNNTAAGLAIACPV